MKYFWNMPLSVILDVYRLICSDASLDALNIWLKIPNHLGLVRLLAPKMTGEFALETTE